MQFFLSKKMHSAPYRQIREIVDQEKFIYAFLAQISTPSRRRRRLCRRVFVRD